MADAANAGVELASGRQMYNGNLSYTADALTSGRLGYGQYYGELAANTVTVGTYNQGKALYQLEAGQITVDQASQQIGGILEIINELAEQTNILAINANSYRYDQETRRG